jgi:hypothetical protein
MAPRQRSGTIQRPLSFWKRRLGETLLEQNVIYEKFTGKALLYFNNGDLVLIERTVTLK